MDRANASERASAGPESPVAAAPPALAPSIERVLALQGSAGNAAVARLLRSGGVLARGYEDVDGTPVDKPKEKPAAQPTVAQVAAVVGPSAFAAALQPRTQPWHGPLLSVDTRYANETSSSAGELTAAIANVEKDVQAGKGNFRDIFMRSFGWSESELDTYIVDVPSGGHAPGPKGVHVDYLDDARRAEFEVEGAPLRFTKRVPPEVVDTAGMFSKRGKAGSAIYVLLADGRLLVGDHKIGLFQHSSLAGGGTVVGAGDMTVTSGGVRALSNHSGHYKPMTEHMQNILEALLARGAVLSAGTPLILAQDDGTTNEVTLGLFVSIFAPQLAEPFGLAPASAAGAGASSPTPTASGGSPSSPTPTPTSASGSVSEGNWRGRRRNLPAQAPTAPKPPYSDT
jgi:hypothetical protein